MATPDRIIVEFTRAEALALFEYLRRSDDTENYEFFDEAEQRVIWNLEGKLERQLGEIFDPNYKQLLAAAWKAIRDSSG
jgi:hypothetical protein